MVDEPFSLEGRVAVITGGKQGWLETIALCLAEAGSDIAFACNEQDALAAVSQVEKLGRRVRVIPTDVTDYNQVEAMIDRVISQCGKIDILINSNELAFSKPLLEINEEEWRKVVDVNLNSVFLCTKAVGKYMVPRKKGTIVTFTSGLGERGLVNGTAYCASHGGVIQFTKALALEWARYNIRVNAIAVGWMAESLDTADVERNSLLARYIPLRRLCQPDDIGALLVYLASDASSFVTGQTYRVDGGVMAHG